MTRVPFATREGMDAAGQAVWDEIETSRGGVARNYAALLNNPQAAGAMAELGGYARFETPLPPRIKALAVLTAAREACGHYVWTVNQRPAKEAGLSDEIIAAILEYRAPAGFDTDDATVVQFVQELLRQHRISDATFEAMRGLVGRTDRRPRSLRPLRLDGQPAASERGRAVRRNYRRHTGVSRSGGFRH